MSRTHYQIYKEQTFVLARTLIVKHEEIASSMNDELYYRGYDTDSNPYNWRYYLNLNGEYHQADKDELYSKYGAEYIMVKVPSVLGYREVPFTKEILHGNNSDQTLLNEYYIGSKLFNELVSQYPDFETLIIGILNPIDIDVAINAFNGEILYLAGRYKRVDGDDSWYDTAPYGGNTILIEEQEDNIIFELQRYINIFLRQWHNPEYAIGNDLYVVTMLGILYSNIPNVILNIRLGNCKTPRAHTFHIKQYLESFGQIGRYVDFIPIQTSLWLYRNVHYLEANTGKMRTFDMLMENTLTPNRVPMAAYTARHELSNMSDKDPLPTGMFYKEKLNDVQVLGISDDDRTVMDILKNQRDLARDNDKDLFIKEEHIQTAVDWMGDDRINTKVLESEMAEIGDPYPFTLESILFNLWGYSAVKGYYTGSVFANNPISGDRLSFTALDAYILVQYCLNKAVADVELVNIPAVKFYNIPRTINEGDKPSDPDYHLKPSVDKMMGWCVKDVTRRHKVVELSGSQVPNFYSKDSLELFNNASDIYHERIRQYHLYCDIENLEERGDLELLAKRLQWMGFSESLSKLSYKEWFKTVGFNPDDYTTDDLLTLGLEIVSSATGISAQPSTSNTKWLQKSLMAILRHFLSYSVHIIEKHSDSVMAHLEGQTLRFSNIKWRYIGELECKYRLNLSYRIKKTLKMSGRFNLSNLFENTKASVTTRSDVSYDLSTLAYSQSKHTLDVGTYQLGVGLFGLSITETAPIIIDLILVDEEQSVIDPFNISAGIEDAVVEPIEVEDTCGAILGRMGVQFDDVIDPIEIEADSNIMDILNIQMSRDDTLPYVGGDSSNILQLINMTATLTDDALIVSRVSDDSYFDHSTIAIELVDDMVSTAVVESDRSSIGLGVITGSVTNPSINFKVSDTSGLSVNTMSIRISDPQIPGIGVSDFGNTMSIVNITGHNDYVAFEMFAKDTMSVSMDNISAVVTDAPVDSISTHSSDVMQPGTLTAMVDDFVVDYTTGDMNAITQTGIAVSSSDDPITTGATTDTMGVVFDKIVIDSRVQAVAVENDALRIVSMSAVVTDDSSGFDDETSHMLGLVSEDIIGSIVSIPDALELLDTETHGIQIMDVTINKVEYPLAYNVIENDSILLSNMSIRVDAPDVTIPPITDIVSVQTDIRYLVGISVDVNPDIVSYDTTALLLPTLNASVSDNQVDNRNVSSNTQLISNMSATTKDDIVENAVSDLIVVDINKVSITVLDEAAISSVDVNGVVNHNMYSTVVDAFVTVSTIKVEHSIDLQSKDVTLTIGDSDIMRSATDLHGLNINSAAISITVVDDNTTQNP